VRCPLPPVLEARNRRRGGRLGGIGICSTVHPFQEPTGDDRTAGPDPSRFGSPELWGTQSPILLHRSALSRIASGAYTTRSTCVHEQGLRNRAPVVAQALGYHHGTTTKHRTAAGGTWNRYPAQR
jgi:hypothetical protein